MVKVVLKLLTGLIQRTSHVPIQINSRGVSRGPIHGLLTELNPF